MTKAVEGRWGSREAEILAVEFVRSDGVAAHVFESGEALAIRMQVRAHQPVEDLVFGVALFNADGVCCYGTNTDIEGAEPREFDGRCGGRLSHRQPVPRRRHLQSGRRRSPQERRAVRLSPAALHDPGHVESERGRHRPAARTGGSFRAVSESPVCENHHFPVSRGRRRRSLPAVSTRGRGRVVFTNGVFDLLHPGHVRY